MHNHQAETKTDIAVNREIELQEITSILSNMKSGESRSGKLLNWFGIPGIGKSTLCRMIGEVSQKLKVPHYFFNFSEYSKVEEKNCENFYTDILDGIYSAFQEKLSINSLRLKTDFDAFSYQKKNFGHYKDLVKALIEDLYILLQDIPLVVVFDSIENAEEEKVSWIESEIISPLCFMENWVIIWAGRIQQKWNLFEVRSRSTSRRLDALTLDSTRAQVGDEGCRVYNLTWGHPGGNNFLRPIAESNKSEKFLIAATDKWVKDDILRDFDKLIVEVCRVLSVVRRFDLNLADDIINKYLNDSKPSFGIMTLIGTLYKSSLAGWDGIRKGYALDNTLRCVLRSILKIQNQNRFIDITQHAIKQYEKWIEKIHENKTIYLLEWLYHRTNLDNILNNSDSWNQTKAGFTNYVNQFSKADQTKTLILIDQLYRDLSDDHELEILCGEERFQDYKLILHRHLIPHREI